jgi:hypothetical protein
MGKLQVPATARIKNYKERKEEERKTRKNRGKDK